MVKTINDLFYLTKWGKRQENKRRVGRMLAAQRAELATVSLGSGKPQCAEAHATAALRADPDNETAQGLLQLLNDDAFQLGDADPDDEDQAFALHEHDPVAPPSPW